MIPTTSAASTPSRNATIIASNIGPPFAALRRGCIRAGRRLGAAPADAVDLQTVGGGQEAVSAADLRLQGGDARAHELHHPAAGGAHQMVVPLAAVDVLVEEAPAPQTLLARQAAQHQQVQVAVDRGARDLEAAGLDGREQLLGVEVSVLAEHLVEEHQPLGGDALAALAQKA